MFKSKTRSHAVTRDQVEGEWGLVILPASEHKPGVIRFSTPLLGEDEWPFKCAEALEAGEQAKVIDVQDEILIISKRN